MTGWPPLTCAHRGCRANARWAVSSDRASYPSCDDHLRQVHERCGEPAETRPLDDAGEPDQPTLYDQPNGDAA